MILAEKGARDGERLAMELFGLDVIPGVLLNGAEIDQIFGDGRVGGPIELPVQR
jgi:hypothetical protein